MKKFLLAFCSVFALSIIGGAICFALAVPPSPPLEMPIADKANILTDEQENELSQLINADRAQTTNQVAVLIIPSLEGEVLEAYSIKVARQWGVGEKDKDNGVLLLVAMKEHKLRIEVGTGLEGDLTDARASRIIRNVITPEFKQGSYYEGIKAGLVEIQKATRGEAESATLGSGEIDDINFGNIIEIVFYGAVFLFMIISWIISILARTKTWWAGGIFGGVVAVAIIIIFGIAILSIIGGVFLVLIGLLLDYFVSKNFRQRKSQGLKPSWWAGGTTLGGSGSGSGGFGGGGFGGGGASGGW